MRALLTLVCFAGLAIAGPFLGTNPAIPANLQITTFVSGLNFPYGLYQLPDGAILTATTNGALFGSSIQIQRITQTNGVADPPSIVFNGGAGPVTGLTGSGNIVAVAAGINTGSRILILQAGAGGLLSQIGQLTFNYPPGSWDHDSHAIAIRSVPGQAGTYQLVFSVGSQFNQAASTGTAGITGMTSATLNPDSVYSVSFNVNGTNLTAGPATQLAFGLRNAFALGFNANGDIYIGENGIDLNDTNVPVSSDFFGIVPSGSGVLNFGFPKTYYDPVNGQTIGPGAGVAFPFAKFLPLAGAATQGVGGLAVAPSGFPASLNNGVFFGFFGNHFGGAANNLNGVVYVDSTTGQYFNFLPGGQNGLGHPVSFLSTGGELYIGDMSTIGADTQGGSGSIYRVSLAETVSAPSLSGPPTGFTNTTYTYSASGAASSQGHTLQYYFDWGDGTNSGWIDAGSASHTWPSAATYLVKAQARCGTDTSAVSSWSNSVSVTINYAISGQVTVGSVALGGVTMTLVGGPGGTRSTDASGNYSFTGLTAGVNYTVTPSLANYTFTPSSATLTNLQSNQTTNFVATAVTYTISGSAALPGVTVALTGGPGGTRTTDASGNYSFTGLPAGGNYTLTPSLANYTFTPSSTTVNNLQSNQTANFSAVAVTYTISGSAALPGVTVALTGGPGGTRTTDASGNYLFTGLPAGVNYTVTPLLANYTFTPPAATFTNLQSNQTANFVPTAVTYTISGSTTISGVSVTLTGGPGGTRTTDASGNYLFTGLPAGVNYTVTPSLANYRFTPSSTTVNNLQSNQTDIFVPTGVTYTISGSTTISGVTVSLTGGPGGTRITDASGNYSFSGLPASVNYTVTPLLANYTFTPPVSAFSNLQSNQTANFSPTALTYTISGSAVLPGVTVALAGGPGGTRTTDASGNYSFTGLPAGGNYTLTPSLANYTFTPLSTTVNNLQSNQTANFSPTALTYTISGSAVLPGVTVALAGGSGGTRTTDASGNYSFTGLSAGGNYTLTPSLANYTFTPLSTTVNNLQSNQTANFSPAALTYTISGSAGLAGVTMTLTGGPGGTRTTDASGNYSFTGLPAGGNYTLTPSLANYTFTPLSTTVNNLQSNQTANFSTTAVTYTISGSAGLAGVTMTLTGGPGGTRTTDASRNYSFNGLAAGVNYTVTASLTNYTFTPSSTAFNNLQSNQSANFSPTSVTYAISGNAALPGSTVTLTGGPGGTRTTDASSNYSFTGLPAGVNYTVTPALPNYTFTPSSTTVNNLQSNQTANFVPTAVTYTISGSTTISGVSVTLTGGPGGTRTTDSSGNYSFTSLPAGVNYTVTPSLANYTFTPPVSALNNLQSNQTVNFLPTALTYTISGSTTNSGATVTLTGGPGGSRTTDASGIYSFTGLPAGGNYTLTPSLANYTFTPSNTTVNNLQSNRTSSFTATAVTYTISGQVTSVLGQFTVTPNSVVFAAVPAATQQSQLVTITSSVPTPITIQVPEFFRPFLAVDSVFALTTGSPPTARFVLTVDAHGLAPSAVVNQFLIIAEVPGTNNQIQVPVNVTVTGSQSQLASQTVASPTTVVPRISGGTPLSGVTVTLSGGPGGTRTTDASGNYSFTGLLAGSNYLVSPSVAYYSFTPPSTLVNNLASDVMANFTGSVKPGVGIPDKAGTTYSGYSVLDANGNFAWDGPTADKLISWSTFQASEKPIYGDWNGDGKTKVGVYNNGTWLLDYNGNGVWDGPTVDKAIFWSTGQSTDIPVMGDWNGDGKTKIGIYNNGTWILDYNGNGVWEGPSVDKTIYWSTGQAGEVPVVGDWNRDGKTKIGVHVNGTWILEYNGNFAWDGTGIDKLIFFGGAGYSPMVGDWNGSGWTKIGAYHVNGTWALDFNGNFVWDGTSIDRLTFFGGPEWTPVVGDWSGNGVTKIGAYTGGQWALDFNGNFGWDPPIDKLFSFGAAGQTPIVGKW